MNINNQPIKTAVLSGLLLCHSAPAQTATEKESYLEEIVVTATRTERSVWENPASLSVLTLADIRASVPEDIAAMVRQVPGVHIADSGQAGMKRIRLRGEDSNRVAILIDGQEITDHRGTGVPLTLAPGLVQRIEVVRGGGAVLYGTKALGGVVNFITAKGGEKPFQATVSGSFDSTANAERYFASAYGDIGGWKYRLAATDNKQDNRETPDGDIDNTEAASDSRYLYLGKTFGAHQVELRRDDHDAFSEVFVEPEVRTRFPFIDFALEMPRRNREKTALFYQFDNGGDFLEVIKASAFQQQSERLFITHPVIFLPPALTIATDTRTASVLDTEGAVLQTDWRFGRHYVIGGLHYTADRIEQQRLRFDAVNVGPSVQTEQVDDRATMQTHAAFIQDEWQFTDALALTAGLRQYWVSSKLEQTTRADLATADHDDRHVIGSLALVYTGWEGFSLRLGHSQGYVYPSLLQLATGAIAGSSFANPNPGLIPETNENTELGFRFRGESSTLDVGAFFTSAEDYIDFVDCGPGDRCIGPRPKIYRNLGESTSFGVELFAQQTFARLPFRASLNLTWLRRKNQFGDFSTYASGLPALNGALALKYDPSQTGFGDYWWEFSISGQTQTEERESGGRLKETAGWVTYHLKAGFTFGPASRYQVVIEGLNLSDKRYSYATENLPAAGRGLRAQLRLDF